MSEYVGHIFLDGVTGVATQTLSSSFANAKLVKGKKIVKVLGTGAINSLTNSGSKVISNYGIEKKPWNEGLKNTAAYSFISGAFSKAVPELA